MSWKSFAGKHEPRMLDNKGEQEMAMKQLMEVMKFDCLVIIGTPRGANSVESIQGFDDESEPRMADLIELLKQGIEINRINEKA